jgi:hypothetical protein
VTPAELRTEAFRLSGLIDQGVTALREQSKALAQAERNYRRAKSEAWVRCPNDPHDRKGSEREWTAARREAWVDAECADLRYERDLAEGVRQAALEAVRSRRTQLSALQSLLAADREEAGLARTAGGMTP